MANIRLFVERPPYSNPNAKQTKDKIMASTRFRFLFCAIAAVVTLPAFANHAFADLITTETGSDTTTGFTLTSTNVLASTASVNTSTLERNWATDVTLLNDGSLGSNLATIASVNGVNTNSVVTFTFDTTKNTLGYDITGIQTYAGWDTSVSGRSNQGYEIDITYINGSTAVLLAKTSWANNNPVCYWTEVSITNSSGTGILTNGAVAATGVSSITFKSFDASASNGGPVGYREFAIEGTATVPEPGTAAMLLTGVLGLLSFVWQRRK